VLEERLSLGKRVLGEIEGPTWASRPGQRSNMTKSIELLDKHDDDGAVDDAEDEGSEEWLSRHMKMQGFSDKCAKACPSFKITICALE
jgi:hypothetical protein